MMRSFFIAILLIICTAAIAQPPPLMPMPARYTMGAPAFRLTASFRIEIQGNSDERIYQAATRFYQRLSERTGIFFPTWQVTATSRLKDAGLLITVKRKGELVVGEDESYHLQVNAAGVVIDAVTDIGAIRALETLLQLIASDNKGYYFSGITIEDAPRFPWRGLLIAMPYHFMPMDVIKRTLDAMAAVKMNVLHFYISDDQGYRIESKIFPRLHEIASDGMYFSQEQVREMITYAHQRGIRVVPEIDLPGHSTAILTAYPHLASIQRNYELQDHFGVFDPTIDPTRPTTYTFLDSLLTEVAALFPDQYFHIGGDENTGRDWQKNPAIWQFMKDSGLTTTLALQNYFNQRIRNILARKGKIAIGWDEVLMKEMDDATAKKHFNEGRYDLLIEKNVPKDMVIQSWRGMEALLASAKNGYRSILSKGYYIDLVQPASYHYLNDPFPFRNEVIVPDSEANLNRFESDIINKIKKGEKLLTPAEEQLILGGEATMWTEHVTAETIDSRIWPRTAAIAERLWSPADLRDVDDMYRRMDIISIQLESLGCTHLKNSEMLLRRLAGRHDVACLKAVTQYLEPVQGYQRNKLDNFTRFSPYTLAADIAVPDQKAVRDLRRKLLDFSRSADTTWKKQAIILFQSWIDNDECVQETAKQIPALADIAAHATHLRQLATLSIQLLQSRQKDKALKSAWEKALNRASQPLGHCELKVTEPVKMLLQGL
jgi:hexosaminidase